MISFTRMEINPVTSNLVPPCSMCYVKESIILSVYLNYSKTPPQNFKLKTILFQHSLKYALVIESPFSDFMLISVYATWSNDVSGRQIPDGCDGRGGGVAAARAARATRSSLSEGAPCRAATSAGYHTHSPNTQAHQPRLNYCEQNINVHIKFLPNVHTI